MEIKFLGTAAAEGIPAAYCECPICHGARQKGGKDFRTRSSVVINDYLKIDFPPDTHVHAMRDPKALLGIKHILITHDHSDHLNLPDLCMCRPHFAHRKGRSPVHVYAAAHIVDAIRAYPGFARTDLELHTIEPYAPFAVGEAEVTPLPAEHGARSLCLIFKVTMGGRSYLHAYDTATISPDVVAFLQGEPVDVIAFDCTQGIKEASPRHGSLSRYVELIDRLRDHNIISDHTRLIATHFSHNGGALHAELEAAAEPHGITIAYDGLRVSV